MESDRNFLTRFVLEAAESQPLLTRARLYRARANEIGDEKEGRELRALAAELEAADRRCRRFRFDVENTPKKGNGI